MHGIGVHGNKIHSADKLFKLRQVVLAAAASPGGKIVGAGDPQGFRQHPLLFQVLQMVHPAQDDAGLHIVLPGPVHHRFVPHGDDLHDVGVLQGELHGAGNLPRIVPALLVPEAFGQVRPRVFAIDPGAQHQVHLKPGILLLQLPDRLQQVRRLVVMHVVGAQDPDPHGRQQAHVFFQLWDGGLDLPGLLPVTAVGNGLVGRIAQYFGGRLACGLWVCRARNRQHQGHPQNPEGACSFHVWSD